ncbi:hypothetical protein SCLCIDRAFT_1212655 [Scleroderma citrinum Foug A]|uniref:Uncharacterized protein n=1 Tax=Scleroderma citrinum Foug A TaxID=1036808 RepID=A0A0C3E9F2_9AGAM|nr:hypothetical protein SCLCIDRAFT_1212655 [Scleroderma citrinum Foug A]
MPSAPASTQKVSFTSSALPVPYCLFYHRGHAIYAVRKLNHSGSSPGMMHIIITRGNALSKLI